MDIMSYITGVVNLDQFIVRLLIAVLILIVGVFIGKFVKFLLRKLVEQINLKKLIKKNLIELFLTVIKWAIYVIFIDIALIALNVPALTAGVSSILEVFPALVAALLIIVVGFGVGSYLRKVIKESGVQGWRILADYFYYFILYVFGVYALKVALVSIDAMISNILIVAITVIIGFAIAVQILRDKKKK